MPTPARLAVAADAAASTKLYHRAGPAWRVRSLYFATIPKWMMDILAESLFADIPREQLPGTPESEIDVVVDVSDLAARKRAAVTAHRSEIDRSRAISGFMSLPDDIQEGDYVIFHGAGAYSVVTNTRFNGFGELRQLTVMGFD